MVKHVTGNPDEFLKWFPEIDKRIFRNFRVNSIVIKVQDFNTKPVEFKFTVKADQLNPLADYKSC